MSKPTPATRAVTYERDGRRCVSCGTLGPLQYQHRAAEGMGGKAAAPLLDEGVTSCALCNPKYEGVWQTRALVAGWKVRRWVVEQGIAYRVPVFVHMHGWVLLDREGGRTAISAARARGLMVEVYGDEYLEWEQSA